MDMADDARDDEPPPMEGEPGVEEPEASVTEERTLEEAGYGHGV